MPRKKEEIEKEELVEENHYKKDKPRFWISEYSLFAPKTRNGLLYDYPDLKNVEEFKKLSVHHLLFVWYFACEASPIYNIKEDEYRSKEAVKYVQTLNSNYFTGLDKTKFENLNFENKVLIAIKKMSSYRMGPRIRAKKMIDQALDNYERIVNFDINSTAFMDKEDNVDFDKIAKYTTATTNIMKNLPILVQQAEEGFAITNRTGQPTEYDDEESIMDDFHDNLDD